MLVALRTKYLGGSYFVTGVVYIATSELINEYSFWAQQFFFDKYDKNQEAIYIK